MNNWNDNHKYQGNYGGYTEPGEYEAYILWGIGIFLLLCGIVIGYHHLRKYYEPGQIIGCAIVFSVILLIASTIVYSISIAILEWWDRLTDRWWGVSYKAPNTQKTAQNSYNQGSVANKPVKQAFVQKTFKRAYLLAGERNAAPRAAFFGRLDGVPIETLGKYEEKWLNTYEYSHWTKQKECKDALRDGFVDETFDHGYPVTNSTTKLDI